MKSKLALWQPCYYNPSTEKFMFLKYSFFAFENVMEILHSNSIILEKDLMMLTRNFEIFSIGHYADDIGNKNISSKY